MERTTGSDMARNLLDFVNDMCTDKEGFADELMNAHRTLQQNSFRVMILCIKKWAYAYDEGTFDLRNKQTCKICNDIVSNIDVDGMERFRIYSSDWERKRDHNPSLFLSDVKRYCETNQHHLGRKPLPYSDSIWRMPKMESLIEIVLRMNKQPESEVNHEAKRYVYKK